MKSQFPSTSTLSMLPRHRRPAGYSGRTQVTIEQFDNALLIDPQSAAAKSGRKRTIEALCPFLSHPFRNLQQTTGLRATFKGVEKEKGRPYPSIIQFPNKPPGSRRATEGESRHERIYPGICSPVHAHVRHLGGLGPIADPESVATGSGGGSDGVPGTDAL